MTFVITWAGAETCSAGDCLTYFLQEQTDAVLVGNTSTWGSGQGIGGRSILSGGEISIRYPIMLTPDADGTPAVDPKADRKARILLDEQITYSREEVLLLFGENTERKDRILEEAMELFDRYDTTQASAEEAR